MKLNDIEAHIKSKLSKHTEYRPDASTLWNNIVEELEKDKNRNRFPFWLWLCLPAILLAGGMVFVVNTISLPLVAPDSPPPIETKSALDSTNLARIRQRPPALLRPPLIINTEKEQDIATSSTSPRLASSSTPSGSSNLPPQITPSARNQPLPSTSALINISQKLENKRHLATNKYPTVSIATLAPIPTKLAPLLVTRDKRVYHPTLPDVGQEKFLDQPNSWSLLFYGGLQYSSLGLHSKAPDADSYFQQLRTNMHPAWGWAGGFELQQLMPNGMFWSTGLRYSKDWLKLDYEKETVEEVLKEDVLLKVTINAVTRDTLSRLYGNREIDVTTQHRVVHHNSFDWISLPLSLGWQGQKQGWSFGLDLGLQFHFLLKQKGRMLSANEAFFYFNNNEPIYQRFATSVHLRPQLEYAFTPKLALVFKPELNLQLNNQLMIPNISFRPLSYQAHVGLRLNW